MTDSQTSHLIKRAVALLFLLVPLMASASRGPTLQLFPTTVLEDIKETGQVAGEMETGLQDVIARLDRQQQLFMDSKCDGADDDPGCARIAKQLGATYMEMLDVMAQKLPDMERAVNGTRTSLEKRLRSELGLKMTPWTSSRVCAEGRVYDCPSGSSSTTNWSPSRVATPSTLWRWWPPISTSIWKRPRC